MSGIELGPACLEVEPHALGDDLAASITAAWGGASGRLVAQTFGGVLWGRVAEQGLELASTVRLTPERLLTAATLIAARLFAPDRELRVWQQDRGLRACVLREGEDGTCYAHAFERTYALRLPSDLPVPARAWFRAAEPSDPDAASESRPGRLRVRHYLSRDPASGLLRLAEHRLLDVQ